MGIIRKQSSMQTRKHSDGTTEVIACHFGGVSRYWGVDPHEVATRAAAYEKANQNRDRKPKYDATDNY